MESITPFRQFMAFPILSAQQETIVVEIGRRSLRETLDTRQAALLEFLSETMGTGTYALTTQYREQQKQQSTPTIRVAADSSLFR